MSPIVQLPRHCTVVPMKQWLRNDKSWKNDVMPQTTLPLPMVTVFTVMMFVSVIECEVFHQKAVLGWTC